MNKKEYCECESCLAIARSGTPRRKLQ